MVPACLMPAPTTLALAFVVLYGGFAVAAERLYDALTPSEPAKVMNWVLFGIDGLFSVMLSAMLGKARRTATRHDPVQVVFYLL